MDEDAVAGQRLATALMAPLYAGWGAQIVLAGSFFGLFMGISTRTWASFSSVVRGVLLAVSSLLLVQTAFSYSEIVWFGVNQGNRTVNGFLNAHWPVAITPLITGLIGMITQCFLTQRAGQLFIRPVYRWAFYSMQGFLIAASFCGACIVTGMGFLYLYDREAQALPMTFNIGVAIWLLGSALCDTAISATLALLLRSRAKQAGAFNPQTSRLLKTLINTALKTAAPTALFSVVGAGVSLAFAESDLYTTDVPFAFFLPISSFYALSLLTTLNVRQRMARQLSKVGGGGNISGVMETSTPFSHPQGNVNGRRVSMAPSKPTPLRIHVHRSQEVEWEEGDSEEDEEEQRRSMRLKRLRNLSLV